MPDTAPAAPAHRGDLAILVKHHRPAGHADPYTTVDLATVTSIRRDGTVRVVRTVHGEQRNVETNRPDQLLVVSATKLYVAGAMAMAAGRRWPTSNTPGRPWDSLDELTRDLQTHRKDTARG